ncbi:MAG: hypothetical protein KDH99_02895 [Alcanivoracaceae bacterium]|nr:hypothetical protein [Alcanivoracaceae bacterium]
MKRFCLLAGGTAVALSSTVAVAQPQTSTVRDNGFSYNYVQGGFEHRDWDNSLDIDGLDGKISWALDEHLFLRGGLQFFDGDVDVPGPGGNVDADGWQLSAGMGFHTPLKTGLDLVLTGDIVHIDVDNGGDETGYEITGGVRHETTAQVELTGGAYLQDIEDSDFGVFGGALYHVSQAVDVGAEVRFGDDLTQFGLFGRYNF